MYSPEHRTRSVRRAFFGFAGGKIHSAAGNDGGNRMLVDHLGHRIAQQDHILIERLDLSLQFDPVDEINGNRHMLATQGIEKWVLQQLTFVVAHDIFRVQKVDRASPYHSLLAKYVVLGRILVCEGVV